MSHLLGAYWRTRHFMSRYVALSAYGLTAALYLAPPSHRPTITKAMEALLPLVLATGITGSVIVWGYGPEVRARHPGLTEGVMALGDVITHWIPVVLVFTVWLKATQPAQWPPWVPLVVALLVPLVYLGTLGSTVDEVYGAPTMPVVAVYTLVVLGLCVATRETPANDGG